MKALSRLLAILLTTVTCCATAQTSKLPDLGKLSAKYYGNDAPWYLDNIPFFECSDKQIEEVYYYRWKLFRAHIRDVGAPYNYIVTEFIDHVYWDVEPYCSINAAAGHQIYEGRWLRDGRYLDGYVGFMCSGGGNSRRYSENIADASYARYLVNADSAFIKTQLKGMAQKFAEWQDHFDTTKGLYYIDPIHDATEYSIASIDASGEKDGFFGGHVFRPSFNSYMCGNARAISRVALLAGDSASARFYQEKADNIRRRLLTSLWNDQFNHFVDRYKADNQYVHYWNFIRGRELVGYVPWQYGLPENEPKYNATWRHLMDTALLMGRYGLRTVEPSYPNYMRQFKFRYDGKPDCHWDGPSWPYQTTQVLAGMANLLDNYTQDYIKASDYLKILRLYTRQHYYSDGKTTILNLQEDYNPDTGKPIAYQRAYGSDHYNHSCYNDLVITGLCGIRPSEGNTLVIQPILDASIRYFYLDHLLYHGHELTLFYDADGSRYHLGKGLTIFVDGKKMTAANTGGRYEVEIGSPVVSPTIKQEENYALNLHRQGYPIPKASVNNDPDSLYKAIDGRIWFFSEVPNRWTTMGSSATSDWFSLDFGEPRDISMVKLFFYEDGRTYHAPSAFTLEYRNKELWVPVKVKEYEPSVPKGNTVNAVTFDKISAVEIKVNFQQPVKKGVVALVELQCY